MRRRDLLVTILMVMLTMALAGTARAGFVTNPVWANDYWSYDKVDSPSKGYTNDGQYARIYGDNGSLAYIQYSFGSSVLPDPNVYIEAISVTIRAYAPSANGLSVQLLDNGVQRGPTLGASWGHWVADITVTWYGNNGWTPAKLNTNRFRVKFINQDEDEDVYVDSVAVKVYYAYGCVTTGAATNVTNDSATIDGSYSLWTRPANPVNQKGFDYWVHPGGLATPVQVYEPASGDSGTMSSNLTGLLSNTQYGYRAGVRYDPDNAYEDGPWLYFVTLPETTTLDANNITPTGGRLRGNVDPEGSQALSNGFYFSETASMADELKLLPAISAGTAEGEFGKTLTGLAPETTYYYLAFSTNSGGTSYGSVQSFTTPAALPVITTQPANQSITYGANASFTVAAYCVLALTVQWQVSTDGVEWNNVADAISAVTTNTVDGTATSTLKLTKPPVAYSGYQYRALFSNTAVPDGVPTNAASLTVSPTTATIVVNGWNDVYDGESHGATLASATGSGGEDLSASVTIGVETYKDVPGGTVAWSFDNPNYTPQNGTVDITITPADAIILVNGWAGPYDGDYHGVTFVSATGVNAEDLSDSMIIGTETYKDVPGGLVAWSFNNPNYNPQNGDAVVLITPIDATIEVNGWSDVYDGNYHGAALAEATGVGGEDLSASVTIGTETYKDVPGGTVDWSFSNNNYNPQKGSVDITITPADANINVNGWSGVYDGAYHGAALETAAGVGGEDLSGSLVIGTEMYKDVPGGTVDWSFSNNNYNPLKGTVDITITPADANIEVYGWSGVFDRNYHGATLDEATGVGDEDLSAYVTVGTETYKDVPGGTVDWSFSNNNYNPLKGTVDITITPADATVEVNGWSGVYDSKYHGATLSKATGVDDEDLSTSVTVGTETYKDVPGGTVAWSFSNNNYNPLKGTVDITITRAHLTVTAENKTSQYSDVMQELTCGITGYIGGEDSSVITGLPAGLSTTATQTSAAGDYPITVDVSGLSATNYDFTAVKGTYTITKEDAVVSFANTATCQLVATPGGAAPAFSLQFDFSEKAPDNPTGSAAAGDIGKLVGKSVKVTLSPVGPGSPITATGTISAVTGAGYDGVATVVVNFPAGIAVNTYEITVELGNNDYFKLGLNASVFTVYDPSLGFSTGGGWFYWPGTREKTNFGYTMQYGKNGTNVKGNLLLIRHLPNGDIYRVKSNALDAGSLTLGTTDLPMGWANFSGKCTYTSILSDVATTVGNIPFKVYVEDRNDPGTLTDRFWIQVTGYADLSLPTLPAANAVSINGGNIVVPHAPARRK